MLLQEGLPQSLLARTARDETPFGVVPISGAIWAGVSSSMIRCQSKVLLLSGSEFHARQAALLSRRRR